MKSILAFAMLIIYILPQQPDAKEIVRKSNDKLRGTNSYGEMTMTIQRPTWSREISLKSWSEGNDYSLILITAPARDKGTVFLKKDKEIYNWVPSIERTVKLPPSMMMQSWMGSDFNNDDLVQESSIVDDYTHKLDGEKTIDGRDCWKIILTPKPEAAVVWGKIVSYISKKEYLQMRSEFYDEDGELVNIMEGSEVKEIGGRLLPSKLTMTPVDEEGHHTVLTYQNLDFDVKIPDGFFTTQNMKRIR